MNAGREVTLWGKSYVWTITDGRWSLRRQEWVRLSGVLGNVWVAAAGTEPRP